MALIDEPVTIRRYAGRLYNTAATSYVTLDDLAVMAGDAEDFLVLETGSGEDITRAVLKLIIVGCARHG
jgi:polyhydroxyalkanoate synthesis regulator protein